MNWFWFALIALLCWSGSDLFSKIGCCGERDKTAHLKMVVAVGVVMGLHAAYMLIFHDVVITWHVVLTYLPVSLLYILSMALGYVGLRYIELSISSPICNSSGALVAVLSIATGGLAALEGADPVPVLGAVALVCLGVIGLGIVEAREDEDLRARRQEHANRKYAKSWLAICLPIAYCVLDAAGTFADSLVLGRFHGEFVQAYAPAELAPLFANGIPEDLSGLSASAQEFVERMNTASANSANVAYELTFLAAGLACLIYLLVRREKFSLKLELPKYAGAACETVGQLFYIYALSDQDHVMLSAPIISAYCVLSAVWGRIFLREKLSWKHYAMIALVVAGIVILGLYDA